MEMRGLTIEKEKHHHEKSRKDDKRRRTSRSRSRDRSSRDERDRHEKKQPREVPRWLQQHLSVIVVDGKYADSRGEITDVLTPYTCSIRLNSGKTLYEVDSNSIAPIQPRRVGDGCMVLSGENRKFLGQVIEIDNDRRKASVQSSQDEMTIVNEKLSNLCIYTGQLDSFF